MIGRDTQRLVTVSVTFLALGLGLGLGLSSATGLALPSSQFSGQEFLDTRGSEDE